MKYLYAVTLLGLLTSCSTYQYVTLESPIKSEKSSAFVIENDTVRLTYDFSGKQGPVTIGIYNKLKVPLYVDWSKSALIIGDERIPYYNNNSTINADLTSSGLRSSTYRTGSIEGVITNNDVYSFIPPQSLAKESQLVLKSNLFSLSKFPSTLEKNRVNGMKVTSFYFTRETSPLNFRSFLTLSTDQNFNTPIYFDHSFWVSKVLETLAEPKYFIPQGDRFYIRGYIGE
jgi:hypothetical protein